MSHVTSVKTVIKDLDALSLAASELGGVLVLNQTTYKWYGHHMGDYPLPTGITKEMLGKCDHVIRVPGVEYEVGVVKQPDGTYTLAYDFWGPGQGLLRAFGENCQRLAQGYAKQAVMREFRRRGFRVTELPEKNGNKRLQVVKVGR